MSEMLKPSTRRLLTSMHSRRESKLTDRKGANGYWIFARPRIRSVADYRRIAEFPRRPEPVREFAERWIAGALAEARRYSEADYQAVRRGLYPAKAGDR